MSSSLSGSHSQHPSLQFVVGNTYRKVPLSEARLDRSGTYHKTHDWTLFVDVVSGDPDLIERVSFDLGSTFQPSVFQCSCPVPVRRPNGSRAWRFSTRQQTYGSTVANIRIRGTGGSMHQTSHEITLDKESARKKPHVETFRENRTVRPFRMLKLPDAQRFGIELELTSAVQVPPETVATHLQQLSGANVGPVRVIRNYSDGRSTSSDWKLVPDESIECSRSSPDCNRFELVSPILQGGNGLTQMSKLSRGLNTIEPKLKVNKSMGFHVHIDVSSLSHAQLIKVCQNFIKYEDAIDSFMPLSRRTGSSECERYFKSNRGCLDRYGDANKQRHAAIAACSDIETLVDMMNHNGRYYKLNLQNLKTGRQPTIEFRQHSATMNYDKISAWVRFCVAFVTNSARLASPSAFQEHRDVEYQMDALFHYVIKDRALKNYYNERRENLHDEEDEGGACCSGCASGGSCTSKRLRV